MTTLEKMNLRRKEAHKKLLAASWEVLDKLSRQAAADMVAKELEITGNTVVNYLNGGIKCGYLAEAMTQEFKRIKDEDPRFCQLHISSKIPDKYIFKVAQ